MHVVHMTVEQHVIGDGLKTFPGIQALRYGFRVTQDAVSGHIINRK